MRKKVGELFEYKGVNLRTVKAKDDDSCLCCYFSGKDCSDFECWGTKTEPEVIFVGAGLNQSHKKEVTKEARIVRVGETINYKGDKLKAIRAKNDYCDDCYLRNKDCSEFKCWETLDNPGVIFVMDNNLVIKVETGKEIVIRDIPYKVVEVPEGVLCRDCGIYFLVKDNCVFDCSSTQMLQPVELDGKYRAIFEVECPYCKEEWDIGIINEDNMECPYCNKSFKVHKVNSNEYSRVW